MAEKTYVSDYDGTMVKVGDRYRTVNRGGVLPAESDPDQVDMLVARKMVHAAADGETTGGIGSSLDAEPPFKLPEDHAARSRGRSAAKDAE